MIKFLFKNRATIVEISNKLAIDENLVRVIAKARPENHKYHSYSLDVRDPSWN